LKTNVDKKTVSAYITDLPKITGTVLVGITNIFIQQYPITSGAEVIRRIVSKHGY
jgi:hypothetical protein